MYLNKNNNVLLIGQMHMTKLEKHYTHCTKETILYLLPQHIEAMSFELL